MVEQVTLLDLSFNTSEGVNGLDELIQRSIKLSDEKKRLQSELKAEQTQLSAVNKAYQNQKISQTDYNKLVAESTTKIVELNKDLLDNKNELSDVGKEIKSTKTIIDSEATSVNALRAQLAKNTAELNAMSEAQRMNSKEGKALTAQTKEISDKLKKMEGSIGDNRRSVGAYAEGMQQALTMTVGMKGAVGSLVGGMVSGVSGVKAFNAALKANPFLFIASILITIIASIEKFINRNSELAASLKAAFAPFQVIFSRLADQITNLFAGVVRVIEKVSEKIMQFLTNIGLLSNETIRAAETAKQLAKEERDLYNKETDLILPLAQMRRELEEQKAIISDQSKSYAERNAAAKNSLKILAEMKSKELDILEAKKKQIEADEGLSYTADERRRKTVEAQAAVEETAARYSAMSKEIISQQTGLEKQIQSQGVAAVKAAEEKKRKTKEDEARKAAENEKKIQAEVLKSMEDGLVKLQLQIRQRQIGIVDKETELANQKEINDAALAIEEERYRQGLITLQEFENKKLELQIDIQEREHKLFKENEKKKREREAENLANSRKVRMQNVTNEYERRKIELELQYEKEIANAKKTGADITLVKQKYEKQQQELSKERMNAELSMAADLAGQLNNLLGQESAAGKTFAIAQATINTYLGATKALATGGFLGIAQMAIVIAAGLKQVATIAKVKDDIPTIGTSKKKLAKGGKIFGPSHAEGGVTFTGSNGQVFEAEGGENMYILNRRASSAINALSALNQEYGGRSFGSSSLYKFADGGKMSVIHDSIKTVRLSSEVKLSKESLKELALIVLEGFENAPNPIVSVQEFNEVDHNSVFIRDSVRD
ncbi:hypothetical protein SAMN05444349_11885 [Bacteroides faecichinchillae]|uniref:Uncharacterized protein n=1 Tax=Bacteroides faecichinchillae TaxID=871325 RepID=A0A1M5BEA9_9BACE|nr:hypothetical protein [Bacteroides faecichinchillae]SHF40768.1 hypothetical protein SAMN05444349_11885 [Bacteroides faecichinchillae]